MTPNTGFQIALSDVNTELVFAPTAPIKMDDAIVRSLTGAPSRQPARSSILMSNLQGKVAFGSINAGLSASNTGFGNVSVGVAAAVQSDMLNPTVTWTYVVESQSGSPQLVFVPNQDQKAGTLVLFSNVVGSHSAQVRLTANVSFNGHVIGVKDRTITLSNQVYNHAFNVTGNLLANSSGFAAQEATTQLVATSNVAGATVSFTVNPTVGTLIQGNTITFTRTASLIGQDNAANYSLTSRLLAPITGTVIAEDTKTVHVRANFLSPDLVLSGPVVNNFFANSGPINSSVTLSAAHGIPSANVVWSYQTLSGDIAILDVAGNKATANLHLDIAGFGAKKSVGRVTASLQYANGYTLNTKTLDVTLRTVSYGLSFTRAANLTIQQYTSSAPSSTATASWQAGTFAWDTARVSGITATLSPAVLNSTATMGIAISSVAGSTRETVYRINPVLTYDGIVVANTESQTRLVAIQDNYTFNVSGATSNTVMGTGTVTSSLTFAANHNITDGYVVWSQNNGSVAMTSNTSSATISIQTTTSNQQPVTVTATLYDSFNRLVDTRVIPANLYAYAPNITFTGDGTSYITPPGYTNPQTSVGSITANINALPSGANFALAADRVTGDTLGVQIQNNTATRKTAVITASASTTGTVTATYKAIATITWNGATYSVPSNTSTWTTTLLAGALTLNQTSQAVADFASGAVEATATVTATRHPGSGTVQWSVPQGVTIVSQNNNQITIKISQSAYGTLAPSIVITGTLYDGATYIDSKQITVTPRATKKNPNLALVGPSSNTQSNMFDVISSIILTPTVNPELSGHTFQFSTDAPIGSYAIGSGNITHTLERGGNATNSGTVSYNVLCIVRDSGNNELQRVTKSISLTANVLMPEIVFGGPNAESRTFLTPVAATTIIPGYTVPSQVNTIWEVNGSNGVGTTSSTATHFTLEASTNSIGTVQATRIITARFMTASGKLIATRSATISALAQRRDPQLTFSSPQHNTNIESWDTPIVAAANFFASVNPALTGHEFRIFGDNVSGMNITINNSAGTASISRTTAGSDPVTTSSLVRCELWLNGVQIGSVSAPCRLTTTPYYLRISPPSATSDVSTFRIPAGPGLYDAGVEALLSYSVSSNHYNFSSSPISAAIVSAFGDTTRTNISVSYPNQGNPREVTLSQGQKLNTTSSSTGTFSVSFNDGIATRTATAQFSLKSGPIQFCVDGDMWLDNGIQAKDAAVGMRLMTWLPEAGFNYHEIEYVGQPVVQEGVELRTKSGCVLRCSKTTPFALETSQFDLDESKYAPDMLGEKAMVDCFGNIFWDEVVEVIHIDEMTTIPISLGGRNFAAGANKNEMIYSHNAKAPNPGGPTP